MNRLPADPPSKPEGPQKPRMLAGDYYIADDAELIADAEAAARWMERYNADMSAGGAAKLALLRERLAAVGEGTVVRAPFYVDYGSHITLGAGVFLNFGCTILDVMPVQIGDRTLVAPGAQFLTADHPRDAAVRARGWEFGRPITVGCDVWIGGGAVLLPGVTVGDRASIGAGAIVTRDVPADTTVVGNPARPIVPRR